MKRSRSFDRLLVAPIGIGTLVFAKIFGAVLFGFINAFIPVAFALFVPLNGIDKGLRLRCFPHCRSIRFIACSLPYLQRKCLKPKHCPIFSIPMLFLCGLFIPVDMLPGVLKPLSYCLPLTYGTDLIRGAVTGNSAFHPLLNVFILFLYGYSFSCAAKHPKNWIL